MVDLEGKDKGNISLPPRLQSPDDLAPDFVEEEHKLPIINMQEALYGIQIRDKEKRIRRLENRNSELSKSCEDTEALIKSLDIETGDQIAQLNKQISVQADKIEETRKSMNFIQKQRKEEKEVHTRKVNSVNEKYEATHTTLTSAIKALNAQINTLEDYKQTREELREKLRIRDTTMAENEEQVTQKLETVDRKFKIDREKLKNELHCRLLALSGSVQIEMSNAFPIPVRRLLRENIFISNEMAEMAKESLKKKEKCTIIRSVKNLRTNVIRIDNRRIITHLKTVKVQRHMIKALKKKHSNMKNRLENLDSTPDIFAQEKYDDLAELAKIKLEAFNERRRKLEVLLHRESAKLTHAKFIHNRSDLRAKKYEETVYDLKYVVACVLKMAGPEEDILEMSETQLVSHLMNIIIRGNSRLQCLRVASAESVPRLSDVYAKGDLGFVPDHIEFIDFIKKEVAEPRSPEVVSINVTQALPVLPSSISLEVYDGEMDESAETSREGSSENEASIESKESKEEAGDSGENVTPVESEKDKESSSESKQSNDAESDAEEQE